MLKIHYLKHFWGGADFWAGMVLVRGQRTCMLLDTAIHDAVEETLQPFFSENHIPWESLTHIINTHSHSDHVECNQQIQALSGAKTAIHHSGADALRKSGQVVDLTLNDGDAVSNGEISLRIIHTPGHSADSCCILESETGTLFSGDSIQCRGSVNIGLALYADPLAYQESQRKIRALCASGEVRKIILGHPEQPCTCGIVEQADLLDFMDLSIETVDTYRRIAENLLKMHPDADWQLMQKTLLRECHAAPNPGWVYLADGVSAAHLALAKQDVPYEV